MDLAMKKAKEVGIGWVTCTGQENSHLVLFSLHGVIISVLFKVDSCIKINFNSIASNHYGIAGYYSMRAMQQGLIVSLNSWSFKAES